MSRTKRIDLKKIEGKRPDFVFAGFTPLPETPEWERTLDRKKWHKPNSRFKKPRRHKRRAQDNQEIKNLRAGNLAPDEVSLPKHPKTDIWDWN